MGSQFAPPFDVIVGNPGRTRGLRLSDLDDCLWRRFTVRGILHRCDRARCELRPAPRGRVTRLHVPSLRRVGFRASCSAVPCRTHTPVRCSTCDRQACISDAWEQAPNGYAPGMAEQTRVTSRSRSRPRHTRQGGGGTPVPADDPRDESLEGEDAGTKAEKATPPTEGPGSGRRPSRLMRRRHVRTRSWPRSSTRSRRTG